MKPNLDPEDYYMSEEGFIVFTAKYHLKRGYCCQSGCRHCPYGFNKKTGRFDRKQDNNEKPGGNENNTCIHERYSKTGKLGRPEG